MKISRIRTAALALLSVVLALPYAAQTQARTAARTDAGTAAPLPTASATLDCGGGKKITVSTGTSGGSCTLDSKGSAAQCTANAGGGGLQLAFATCDGGCKSINTGTCAITH